MQSDEVIEKASPNECRSFRWPFKQFVTWQGGAQRGSGGVGGGEDGQKLKRTRRKKKKKTLSFRYVSCCFSMYVRQIMDDSNGWGEFKYENGRR